MRLQTAVLAKDPELAMFIQLAAMTGARRSELLALRWRDIDGANRLVMISRGIVMGPDGLIEEDTKTHRTRRVAIDDVVALALEDHKSSMRARAELCSAAIGPNSFVFSADVACERPWFPDREASSGG